LKKKEKGLSLTNKLKEELVLVIDQKEIKVELLRLKNRY
jgi:hypothetical protein